MNGSPRDEGAGADGIAVSIACRSQIKHHRRVTFIDLRFDKQTELRAEQRVLDHVAPDGAFNSGAHLGY